MSPKNSLLAHWLSLSSVSFVCPSSYPQLLTTRASQSLVLRPHLFLFILLLHSSVQTHRIQFYLCVDDFQSVSPQRTSPLNSRPQMLPQNPYWMSNRNIKLNLSIPYSSVPPEVFTILVNGNSILQGIPAHHIPHPS